MQLSKFNSTHYAKLKPWLGQIVAKSMKIYPANPRWDAEELMSVGWVAVLESWQKYNPSFHVPFKIFARRRVIQHLLKFISANMFTLTVQYHNIKKNKDALTKAHNTEVSMLRSLKGASAFEYPDNELEDSLEIIPSKYFNTETEIENKEEKEQIRRLVKGLDKNSRQLIKLRYVQNKTLGQISVLLKDSTENVRRKLMQIEAVLLERMHNRGY